MSQHIIRTLLPIILFSFFSAQAEADFTARPHINEALQYLGEFRVINWNAAARDLEWNGPTAPTDVANIILQQALAYDANIITLQEMSYEAAVYLIRDLGPNWDCHFSFFGTVDLYVDLRVTCVQGTGTNYRAKRLQDIGAYDDELVGKEWWGYTQLEYFGILITNVHTRDHWADEHVAELHAEVKTGIVAGDFNHERPELLKVRTIDNQGVHHVITTPEWFQTDVDREATWQDEKIDHVLTVEKPIDVEGYPLGKWGSNHEMLFARFRLVGTIIKAGPLPTPSFVPTR